MDAFLQTVKNEFYKPLLGIEQILPKNYLTMVL